MPVGVGRVMRKRGQQKRRSLRSAFWRESRERLLGAEDRVDGTVGIPGSGLSYKERLSNRGCASVFVFVFALATLLAGAVAWAG